MQTQRLSYLDNVRTLIILSLFLVHACEIYHVGDGFFVEGPELLVPTMVYTFFETFIMSVLFFFAGESTVYSLKSRSIKAFYANRCKKLLLPYALALLTLLPLQAWFVLKNHSDFDGNFLDAYKYFYTHYTGFIGYDGSFCPAHLWFVVYLFLITLVCFPLIKYYDRLKDRFAGLTYSTWWVLALIIAVFFLNYGPSDEGVGRFIMYYVLGIVLAENQSFSDYMKRYGKILFLLGIIANAVVMFLILRIKEGNIFTLAYMWRRAVWAAASALMTLGTIGMGMQFLNRSTALSRHFSRISFLIYCFHLPFMCAAAYFVLKLQLHYWLQILLIMLVSFFPTLLISELAALRPRKKV